jgi:hypothetical protein
MSSSFRLSKRFEEKDIWSFEPRGTYGDSYIRNWGECHPNFKAYPIAYPEGPKICVRRKAADGKPLDVARKVTPINGFFRYRFNMYDPTIEKPIQRFNPDAPVNRRPPEEDYLMKYDYLARDTRYQATGLEGIRTEGGCGLTDENPHWIQYGNDWALEPASKYDVTRLHQAYVPWKKDKEFVDYIPKKAFKPLDVMYNQRTV